MQFLSNSKLSKEQFKIVRLIENIIAGPDFRAWFCKTKFTELSALSGSTSEQLFDKFFKDSEHRFSWKLIDRPWYKRFSSEIGTLDLSTGTIFTYRQKFESMSQSQLCGYFAHEMSHIMGFTHSIDKSDKRGKSLPYQLEKYICTASELMSL